MSTTGVQAWVGIVAAILTAVIATFKYFNYKSKRDRIAGVGVSFAATVDALSSDNEVKRMAAAVLLRRFFDTSSEQAVRGKAPYHREAIEVIAGLLRDRRLPPALRKVLADGLRYAVDLRHADLQLCNLSDAFLGIKDSQAAAQDRGLWSRVVERWGALRRLRATVRDAGGAGLWLRATWRRRREERLGKAVALPRADLSDADLYKAICRKASFRNVTAKRTVFFECDLERAVLVGADMRDADFRQANLRGADFRRATVSGADFTGAMIGGAKFAGAQGLGQEVAGCLNDNGVAVADSIVSEKTGSK